jgi:putative ABC transport system permease protein
MSLFKKRKFEQELDDELRSYLELQAAEKVRRGMSPEDALREARRELGGMDQVKENVRDIRPGVLVDTLIQDIRYAFRALRRNRAFALVAILTLALGIGANTAIFTVVDGVVLKPLPYPDPDRLLTLWERSRTDGRQSTVAPANFYDWREQSRSFEKMAAIDPYPDFILNGSGETQRLSGADVSADFFSLLGARMELGRDFLPEEDRPGRNHVVILTYACWRRYLGGRADTVGQAVTLNGALHTVAGVLPRDFSFVSKAADYHERNRFDLFRPMALPAPPPEWLRGTHPLCVLARMKRGVTLEQAQAELDVIASNLEHLYPKHDKGKSITAVPLQQHVVADVRGALLTILAAVGLLLLLTCANIANLLLTRAAARGREMALRAALGASPARIARQLMTESLVLTAAGGLLGLILVYAGVPALARHLPTDLPRTAEIAVDGRVLIFTSVVTLLTGLLFGLAPVFYARGPLRQSGRGVIDGAVAGLSRLRGALIAGQVAIAFVLLTGAGLLAKSLWKLLQVPPGFRAEHILTARLSLPRQYTNDYKFGTGAHRQISAFQQRLLERVRAIPGVQSAAFTAYLPLSGSDNSWSFLIEGRPPKPVGEFDAVNYRPVGAGYFETIGIPVERGRGFTASDNEDRPLVMAINESMARKFWGSADPIGQRVSFSEDKWRTIVGIVGDVHHHGLDTKAAPEMYIPYAQAPNVEARPTIVLRTSIEPLNIAVPLRQAVAEVDRGVPIDRITTMQDLVSNSAGQPRFRTAVILTFSLLALFVASIGLYGVMSYVVSQRTQEFGIRIALGATPGAVMHLVLGQAAKLVGIGVALGLTGAALLSQTITTLLYGVAPVDGGTLASVTTVLALVGIAAVYVPARRAAKSDPMESLRHD